MCAVLKSTIVMLHVPSDKFGIFLVKRNQFFKILKKYKININILDYFFLYILRAITRY